MAFGDADREARIDAAITEFLLAREQGRALDPSDWLDRHSDIADDLRAFLDDRTEVDRSIAAILPAPGMRYGHYQLLRILGRGGMGIVFEAESLAKPGRKVAIKVLPSCCLQEPEDMERFLREAEIVAALDHPNIVRLLDAETHRSTPFFTMERINGVNLRKVVHDLRLSRRGRPTASSAYVVSLPEAINDPIPLELDGATSWPAVARIGLQAARALAYAHGRRVLHRDVKPSNLMLDRRGIVYLTDFGIARSDSSADLTETGDVGGAPRFLAPERFHRWCDARSDLYALGLTLYELLTRRPAFEYLDRARLIRAVLTEEPRSPRRIDPAIPIDLETIVLKATSKEPDGRYVTAREMADDFQHFLDGKPILAKPPTLRDRGARWMRRHTAATMTAVVFLSLAVVALSVGSLLIARARRKAKSAEKVAQVRAAESRIERILWDRHASGWSDEVAEMARDAAMLGRSEKLQSLAATSLGGIDAHPVAAFPFAGDAIAFDPAGNRLFLPGTDEGIRIWDVKARTMEVVGKRSKGPIAFRADGAPLVLTPTLIDAKPGTGTRYPLELWNVKTRKTDRRFDDPLPGGSTLKSWTVSADAARVGAVSESPSGGRTLTVWDADDGRILVNVLYPAEGLAFAPDAGLLAAWDGAGRVDLWSLPGGAPVASLANGTSPVHSVAFGPNHWRRGARDPAAPARWLLAAGNHGGTVTIWDLATRQPRAICRGSDHDVMSLAFSPDGATLASAGYSSKLWDVATGEEVLTLRDLVYETAMAFSPDGSVLARSRLPRFSLAAKADVREIEGSRGVQRLRGLPGAAEKVRFSPDGRLVAGLSHDWWVAVWDRASGRLLRVLDAPRGRYADNAGLTFSPDGRRFAFAAGREAAVWNLETGEKVRSWTLPAGFTDALAYRGTDQLLLMRTETKDGQGLPYGNDPANHPSVRPRVERLRDLLGRNPTEPVRVIDDFNWEVHYTAVSPDGSCFVVDGLSGPEGKTRTIKAYDATGARLWGLPSRRPPEPGADLQFDTSGKLLLVSMDMSTKADLIDMRSREVLGKLSNLTRCMSAGAESWVVRWEGSADQSSGVSLHDQDHAGRIVHILTNTMSGVHAKFSPDGNHTAWGNSDGSVSVCDWALIRRRLNDLGLGW